MKWSIDSLWLMSYGKYFDYEMVEWYTENILTMRWSNDFIRHLPYNETWNTVVSSQIGQSKCAIQFNNVLAAKSGFIRKTYYLQ